MSKDKETRADHRAKARAQLFAELEKQFGAGAALPLPEKKVEPLLRIPTGSLALDRALGGGIPRGRIVEISGQESSGKTTLCLSILAQLHRDPAGYGAFIDAEQSFDEEWATKLGVDMSRLAFHQPDIGEEALTFVEKMVKSDTVDLIVVDSVSMLLPRAEAEGSIGDAHMGLQARLMSQALRILPPIVRKSNCAVIFINQLREKIGVQYGNPEQTTGGRALRYAAAIRMATRQGEPIKKGDTRIGDTIKVRVFKNKTSRPHTSAEIPLLYDRGFDLAGEMVDFAAEGGIITLKGSHYYIEDKKIGQGRDNAIAWFRSLAPESQNELERRVRKFIETGEIAA